MAIAKIQNKGEIDFTEILKKFKEETHDDTGAIGTFTGIVRKTGKKGENVKKLEYENAETAEEELEKIATDMEKKFENIHRVEIYHVIDNLKPGDDIIFVLVEGSHRDEVFDTLSETMDRIKKEVHIWKKEMTESDEYWIHEV